MEPKSATLKLSWRGLRRLEPKGLSVCLDWDVHTFVSLLECMAGGREGPRTQFYFTAGEVVSGLEVRLHTGSTIVVQGRLRGVLGGRILEVSEI